MNRKFKERLMMINSAEGRKVRDDILDRFEANQRKQEFKLGFIKAYDEFDNEKIYELHKEYSGSEPSESDKEIYDGMIESAKEMRFMEAKLEDSERTKQLLKYEIEKMMFVDKGNR